MRRIMNMADIPTGAKFLRVHVSGNCLAGRNWRLHQEKERGEKP